MTQTQMIIEHLKSGNALTPIEALQKFGCFRLAARISDLKQLGHEIETKSIKFENGKSVAQYSLKVK